MVFIVSLFFPILKKVIGIVKRVLLVILFLKQIKREMKEAIKFLNLLDGFYRFSLLSNSEKGYWNCLKNLIGNLFFPILKKVVGIV